MLHFFKKHPVTPPADPNNPSRTKLSRSKQLTRRYQSSILQANTQSLNVVAALVNNAQTVDNYSVTLATPNLTIPVKILQSIASINTACHTDTKPVEKCFNAFQALVAVSQLAMSTTLLFTGTSCIDNKDPLCKTAFLLRMVYLGILASGFVSSQLTYPDNAAKAPRVSATSKAYRINQRVNAGTNFLSSGILTPLASYSSVTEDTIAPYLTIPTKIGQLISSGYAVFDKQTRLNEKLINALQALVATAQLGLAITSLFKEKTCASEIDTFCIAHVFLQLVYLGVLAVGVINAEIGQQLIPASPKGSNNTALQAETGMISPSEMEMHPMMGTLSPKI